MDDGQLCKMTMYLEPKTKLRPRGVIRYKKVRGKQKPYVLFHTPEATAEYEKAVRMKFEGYMRARGMKTSKAPMVLFTKFYLPTKRTIDVDNLLKSLCDGGLKTIYHDDAQIITMFASKYHDPSRPRVEVGIYTVDYYKKHWRKLMEEWVQPEIQNLGDAIVHKS